MINEKKMYIFRVKANSATVSPPLSTVLGNMGLNTNTFCQVYNDMTKDLNSNIKLNILMFINTDRSFEFYIEKPTIASILRLISKSFYRKELKSGGLKDTMYNGIDYLDLVRVIIFFFGYFSYKNLVRIYAILVSMELKIILNLKK